MNYNELDLHVKIYGFMDSCCQTRRSERGQWSKGNYNATYLIMRISK
jgi:hypothetical protein